ncbi:hypothetical protein JW992_11945 [candidate division KSB1 bacterium]|nr:hypothetical protein [candidate division KSB1 bacterium]
MNPYSFQHRLIDHHALYPQAQLQDLYKFIHQAALGNGHALVNGESARRRFDKEWQELGNPIDAEPERVALNPDGVLVRVNLRPYRRRGGDRCALFAAFVETASAYSGSRQKLVEFWTIAEILCRDGRLPYSLPNMKHFFLKMQEKGFPAQHHSAGYRRTYHPAYRVVLRPLLRQTLDTPAHS